MTMKEEINYIFTYIKSLYNSVISMNIERTILEKKDVTGLSIGEQIRHFRMIKGFTQKQLGKEIGIDRAYISEIEIGRKEPSIRVLKKIIQILDVEEKIKIPKYTLFLMNNPSEKIKNFEKNNNLSNHEFAVLMRTNITYVKKWIEGKRTISRGVYKKLNELGIE